MGRRRHVDCSFSQSTSAGSCWSIWRDLSLWPLSISEGSLLLFPISTRAWACVAIKFVRNKRRVAIRQYRMFSEWMLSYSYGWQTSKACTNVVLHCLQASNLHITETYTIALQSLVRHSRIASSRNQWISFHALDGWSSEGTWSSFEDFPNYSSCSMPIVVYSVSPKSGKLGTWWIEFQWFHPALFVTQNSMEIMSSTQSIANLSFENRQYYLLTDQSASMNESEYVSIVRQVLKASPNVRHLAIEVGCMPECSSVCPNLQSLHLILEHSMYKDQDPFDVDRFARLAPGLRRLETSVANLMLDQKLIDFILDIITGFRRLVHLVINKRSQYRSGPQKKEHFSQLFVSACEKRGYDGSMIDVRFGVYDEINVWLWLGLMERLFSLINEPT